MKDQKGRSHDIWRVLSALSQVLLVALAVFGYFYTIRPIYQNQLLAEQKAKLDMEREQLRGENAALSDSIEKDKQRIATLNTRISNVTKNLSTVKEEYEIARAAKSRAAEELAHAREETEELGLAMVRTKTLYILESFAAYVFANATAALPRAASAMNVIDLPEEGDLDKKIRAYLGDPYLDTREQIVDYFDPGNEQFSAPGVDINDPIRAKIRKYLLDELDILEPRIAIPESVVADCKNVVREYRAKLKPIEQQQDSLKIDDFWSYAEYSNKADELLEITFELRSTAVKELEDLKNTQFWIFTVMPLVIEELQKKNLLETS